MAESFVGRSDRVGRPQDTYHPAFARPTPLQEFELSRVCLATRTNFGRTNGFPPASSFSVATKFAIVSCSKRVGLNSEGAAAESDSYLSSVSE
jgi:hypothetical protein